MPFPIAHGIVAASLFTASQRTISLGNDWKIILLCAALAVLPDADFILQWFFHIPNSHRGFTHSIAFSLIVGLLAAALVRANTVRVGLALVMSSVSHGLLDALVTGRKGTGIELLWPLTNHGFKAGLFDYFLFNFDPRIDPWAPILIRVLEISFLELLIASPLFALQLFFKLRRQHQKVSPPESS